MNAKNTTNDNTEPTIEELVANPTPEALETLREQYGMAFTVDGHLVKIKSVLSDTLGDTVANAKEDADKITDKLHDVGEIVMANVIDAPTEFLANRRARYRVNKSQRLQARTERAKAREERREKEKLAKQAAEEAAKIARAKVEDS